MASPGRVEFRKAAQADGGEDSGAIIAWLQHTLYKRRWWILVPLFLVPLAGVAYVLRLPDQYTSTAVFALIQQQVPRQYVDQLNSGTNSEMIRSVTREVLAIPRLSGVVDSFGLFASERGTLTSEQLGAKLRESIGVVPVDQAGPRSDFTAFQLSFTSEDPKLAQQVLSQLSSLFIEVNLKERGSQAKTTTAFLKNQMEVAKERMDRQEQVLIGIKMNNLNENPAVNQAKLGVMSDLRMQLQNANSGLTRLAQQRGSIEAALTAGLVRFQNERTALLNTYTAKHPEILKKDKDINSIQSIISALRKQAPLPVADSIPDPGLTQLISQIETNAAETERITKEVELVRSEISDYQNGLVRASSPVKLHQLDRAQKDYDTLKNEFNQMQANYFRSQLAVNLEEDQSGQTFRLVDPPSLPATPSGPKRMKISLGSIGAGLGIGILLAFLLEIRNQTFLREADLRRTYLGALVIGIPVLTTTSETRRKRLKTAMECVAGVIMLGAVAAAQYYVFLHG